MESLPTDEQAAGMASYVAAYRVGMLASGAGVIGLTAWLEAQGLSKEAVWPIAYAVAAALVLVGLWRDAARARAADAPPRRPRSRGHGALTRVLRDRDGILSPISCTRDAAIAVLAFVVLYKLCDALAGTMTAPFVLSLGYDKAQLCGDREGRGARRAADRRICRRRRCARPAAGDRAVDRRHPADGLQSSPSSGSAGSQPSMSGA